jgi:hypothetical protein
MGTRRLFGGYEVHFVMQSGPKIDIRWHGFLLTRHGSSGGHGRLVIGSREGLGGCHCGQGHKCGGLRLSDTAPLEAYKLNKPEAGMSITYHSAVLDAGRF